jgi:hypothetical protein
MTEAHFSNTLVVCRKLVGVSYDYVKYKKRERSYIRSEKPKFSAKLSVANSDEWRTQAVLLSCLFSPQLSLNPNLKLAYLFSLMVSNLKTRWY